MRRGFWIVLAFISLVTCVLLVGSLEDTADVEASAVPPALQPVKFIDVTTGAHAGRISLIGRAKPRWQADLSATVSGRVTAVFPAALAGEKVAKGTPLIQIERHRYFADLQVAKHALAEAVFVLENAQRKTDLARKDWARATSQPEPSDLALHLPALRSAKAGVAGAKAQVATAQENLNDTQVTAPFTGYVTDRMVNLGQTVNVGDALLSLLYDQTLDISVSVGPQDWGQLVDDLTGRLVPVFVAGHKQIATARVRQVGRHLDTKTGLRQIYLEVDNKGDPTDLIAGASVTVQLPGRVARATIAIPDGAITRDGYVWHIDDANRLRKFRADVVFRDPSHTVIRVRGAPHWRIVTMPLAGFLPGSKVNPIAYVEVTQ